GAGELRRVVDDGSGSRSGAALSEREESRRGARAGARSVGEHRSRRTHDGGSPVAAAGWRDGEPGDSDDERSADGRDDEAAGDDADADGDRAGADAERGRGDADADHERTGDF